MGEAGNIREPSGREKLAPALVENGEVFALRSIVEGTATGTGEAFFQSLVRHLATATDTHYAFVAEFLGGERVRTLAYWAGGQIVPNIEWTLPGTPCEEVVRGKLCHHSIGVKDKFPLDQPLVDMGIESYLGVPLWDLGGAVLGHLAVFDERPLPAVPRKLATFQIFAARAATELQRLRAEKLLRESEQRYRDLYEEAPIAYIYEDLNSRFVRANRAAIRLLGLRPEEVPGTLGVTLLAPTPETQQRVREAWTP